MYELKELQVHLLQFLFILRVKWENSKEFIGDDRLTINYVIMQGCGRNLTSICFIYDWTAVGRHQY